MSYKIIRFFQNDSTRNKVIDRGLTLKQARKHCRDPQTSSLTATTPAGKQLTKTHGDWFDGYEEGAG